MTNSVQPTSALLPLVGQRVDAANRIHDYIQIRFETGGVLNIYNLFELAAPTRGVARLEDLIGCSVSAALEHRNGIRLTIGETTVFIDLTDTAFSGPEALEYVPASGSSVVVR